MEINLHKLNVKKLLIPLLLLITAGTAFVLSNTWMPPLMIFFKGAPEPAEVAEQGVSAFYTIDHSKGIGNWVDQYCEVSTDEGCKTFSDIYAPTFWPAIEENEIVTSCRVSAIAAVAEYSEGKKTPYEYQVWLVDAMLTNPFDDVSEKPMEVYAVLKRSAGEKRWVFERILFEDEAQQYQDQEG